MKKKKIIQVYLDYFIFKKAWEGYNASLFAYGNKNDL